MELNVVDIIPDIEKTFKRTDYTNTKYGHVITQALECEGVLEVVDSRPGVVYGNLIGVVKRYNLPLTVCMRNKKVYLSKVNKYGPADFV